MEGSAKILSGGRTVPLLQTILPITRSRFAIGTVGYLPNILRAIVNYQGEVQSSSLRRMES